MATFILKRARWCLEISRSSRNFSVSFSTALPRQHHHSHRIRDAAPSSPSLQTSLLSGSARRTPRHHTQTRSIASSARFRQASAIGQSEPSTSAPDTSELATTGFNDEPLNLDLDSGSSRQPVDWSRSFHGLSSEAFPKDVADALLTPIDPEDVEVKPDGILYLPEIKYRRILNKAFGPGGWGLAPRGETIVTSKAVTREYALVALGRLVSIARGEQDYFTPEGIPTASEGCKSNALLRCCKDLGVASELWDPRFIRKFVAEHVKEVWVEHQISKKRRKIFLRKEDKVGYPYKEAKGTEMLVKF